jgi:DNA-binding FrmR family transcriptional regulator
MAAKTKPQHAPADADARAALLSRLRSIEGHLRGVVQMVEDDVYCMDVLQQTKAVHAALSKVEGQLLDRHLHHCVRAALGSGSRGERERVVGELLDLFAGRRRG